MLLLPLSYYLLACPTHVKICSFSFSSLVFLYHLSLTCACTPTSPHAHTQTHYNLSTAVDDFSELPERPAQPPQLHSTASVSGHKSSPKLGGFMRRIHSSGNTSHSHSESPSPSPVDPGDKKLTKAQRMSSEPAFSGFDQPKDKDKKSGKRLSLLKKKKHASSYAPLSEDIESPSEKLPPPRSPLLSPADKRGSGQSELERISDARTIQANSSSIPTNGGGVGVGGALGGVTKRLSRPVSSPRMSKLSESPTKSPPKGAFTQSLPPPTAAPPTAPPTVLSAPIASSASSTSTASGGGGGSQRKPKRPPPPPPPYARTHGRTGMKVLLITSKDDSDSGGEESRESVSPAPKRDDTMSPPIMMQASSTTPTIEEERPEEGGGEEEKEQEPEVEDISPTKASQSMEDLFKDLEEFDELNSLSLPNGLHNLNKGERDFATIPRSELPVRHDEEVRLAAQSPADTPTPDICVTDEKGASLTPSPEEQHHQDAPAKPPRTKKKQKQLQHEGEPGTSTVSPPSVKKPVSPVPPAKPQVAAIKPVQPPPPSKPPQSMAPAAKPAPPPTKPQLPPPIAKPTTQNGLKEVVPPSSTKETGTSNTVPKAPPRRRSKKMTERMAMYEKKDESLPMPGNMGAKSSKISPVPPSKPKFLKKTHLESLDRPGCSSAPVSRTASPDDRHGLAARGRDTSNSSENIGPDMNPNRSPVVMRRAGDVGSRRDPSFSDDDLEDCTVRR